VVAVDVDSADWGKRDRKVAEKRSGGSGCFDGLVLKILCSARATALGSHIGQTCEEMRIVAIAFFQMQRLKDDESKKREQMERWKRK
jgi:hypothetical protein